MDGFSSYLFVALKLLSSSRRDVLHSFVSGKSGGIAHYCRIYVYLCSLEMLVFML